MEDFVATPVDPVQQVNGGAQVPSGDMFSSGGDQMGLAGFIAPQADIHASFDNRQSGSGQAFDQMYVDPMQQQLGGNTQFEQQATTMGSFVSESGPGEDLGFAGATVPDAFGTQNTQVTGDSYAGFNANTTSALNATNTTAKETNKLREWEQAHEVELDAKAKAEQEAKQEQRQKAAEELSRWYEDRKQLEQKRKLINRSDEQALVAERDAANQPSANPWERVASLIDTQALSKVEAKEEETGNRRTDTTRMKQVLIQLKSNPIPTASS